MAQMIELVYLVYKYNAAQKRERKHERDQERTGQCKISNSNF